MTEAAEIVGRLTGGEREALIRHPAREAYGSRSGGWPQSAHDPSSFCKAGRSLMDKRLLRWTSNRLDSRTLLTPLGVEAQALLKGSPHD